MKLVQRLIAFGEIVQPLVFFLYTGETIRAMAMLSHFSGGTLGVYRVMQFAFYVGACALSLAAGVQLWRSRPSGFRLSIAAQALQIPVISSAAFSYAIKFMCGVWVFYRFDTGFLGFHANLIDRVEFALIVHGDPVPPEVQINLLAVAILIWSVRALRRQRPGYVEKPKGPLPQRLWRFAKRAALVLLLLTLIPLVSFWIYNRIDEKPTPAAEHWFAPIARDVPDAENAWLYMLGLHAAKEDNPIAFGRQRLDAYEARIARPGPRQEPDATEKALFEDALPFVQKDAQGKGFVFCDADKEDCLAWGAVNAERLRDLERSNAVLMQRYETLLGMSRIKDMSTPSVDEPLPDTTREAALYRNLIWRDLGDAATRPAALRRIARAVEFAQYADASGTSLQMKMLGERTRELYMRVLDTLVDHAGATGIDALRDTIDVVLRAPAPAQREWEPTLHREALRLNTALAESVFPGPIDAWRYCTKACFSNWVIAQLYVPQASRNTAAQLWDARLALHDGDPRDMAALSAAVSQIIDATMPLASSARETARRMSYNMSGKTLVAIATPSYDDYLTFQHDVEALRRMLLLKIAALDEHVPAQKMSEFLAQHRETLGNPYNDEAFAWDEATKEIRFVPKSKKWNKDLLTVAYAPVGTRAPARAK